jgi:hypothetical protein
VSGDLHVAEPRDSAPTVDEAGRAGLLEFDSPLPSTDPDSARLAVLQALERGDITVAEATDQLSQLDEVLR